MMVWGDVALRVSAALALVFLSFIVGSLIHEARQNRKSRNGHMDELNLLVANFIKKLKDAKSRPIASTPNSSVPQSEQAVSENFYELVFQKLEKSDVPSERASLQKILNFLKDFSHPQNGPDWRNWANQFQQQWGLAPSKLSVIEVLEHLKKIPIGLNNDIAQGFFAYLNRAVLLSTWSAELWQHSIPAHVCASLSIRLGMARDLQSSFLASWVLEAAGMAPGSFFKDPEVALIHLQKIPLAKKRELLQRMAFWQPQLSWSEALNKKWEKWQADQESFSKSETKTGQRTGTGPKSYHLGDDDDFKILGVAPHDGLHHIKKAYRKLALSYHPDQFAHQELSEFERQAIGKRFLKIKMAFERIIANKTKAG